MDAREDNGERMSVTGKDGVTVEVPVLDVLCTRRKRDGLLAIAAVNKHPSEERRLEIRTENTAQEYRVISVIADSVDAYNDIGHTGIRLVEGKWRACDAPLCVSLTPHSINVVQVRTRS